VCVCVCVCVCDVARDTDSTVGWQAAAYTSKTPNNQQQNLLDLIDHKNSPKYQSETGKQRKID